MEVMVWSVINYKKLTKMLPLCLVTLQSSLGKNANITPEDACIILLSSFRVWFALIQFLFNLIEDPYS